jgi:hypothetical protein
MVLFHDIVEHTYKSKKYQSHFLGEMMAFGAYHSTRSEVAADAYYMAVQRKEYGQLTLESLVDIARDMRWQGREDTDFNFKHFPRIRWQRYCHNRAKGSQQCYCTTHSYGLSRMLESLHEALYDPKCIKNLREAYHDDYDEDDRDTTWLDEAIKKLRRNWRKIRSAILFGYHHAARLYQNTDLSTVYKNMEKLRVDKGDYFEGQQFKLTVNLGTGNVVLKDISDYEDDGYNYEDDED